MAKKKRALVPCGSESMRLTEAMTVPDSVLVAVARWLGYGSREAYNDACETDPDEVRRRLREAT